MINAIILYLLPRLNYVTGDRLQVAVLHLRGISHSHASVLVRIDALAEVNRVLEFLQQNGLKRHKQTN